MRGRLLINYRRDGREHPAGSTIELDDSDLAILGDRVELLDDEGARRGEDFEPLAESENGDLQAVSDALHALREAMLNGFEALGVRIAELRGPVDAAIEHQAPLKGQGSERRSGREEPGSAGRPGDDGPEAGAGSDDPPGAGALDGEAGTSGTMARAKAAMRAMAGADPRRKAPAWWLRDGRPSVDELAHRGIELTAAERDALWAEVAPDGIAPGA